MGSIGFQDRVHETIVSRRSGLEVAGLDGTLEHFLASRSLSFASISKDGISCENVALIVYGVGRVRSDLERHWHVEYSGGLERST